MTAAPGMQIRCGGCGRTLTLADIGGMPPTCPHCDGRPVPERIGEFVLDRPIAAGGMAEVYLAHHQDLGTRVAIKIMPPPSGEDATAMRERFAREARLQAAIDHPGVVARARLRRARGPAVSRARVRSGFRVCARCWRRGRCRWVRPCDWLSVSRTCWPRPMPTAFSTVTSSRRTCCGPRTAACAFSTSASRAPATAAPRRRSRARARSLARRSTWRPSRSSTPATRSTNAPTCTRSASCSTNCSRARTRSPVPTCSPSSSSSSRSCRARCPRFDLTCQSRWIA